MSSTWPSGEKEGAKGAGSLNALVLCLFARRKGAGRPILPGVKTEQGAMTPLQKTTQRTGRHSQIERERWIQGASDMRDSLRNTEIQKIIEIWMS